MMTTPTRRRALSKRAADSGWPGGARECVAVTVSVTTKMTGACLKLERLTVVVVVVVAVGNGVIESRSRSETVASTAA